jgi:hypothetical protein
MFVPRLQTFMRSDAVVRLLGDSLPFVVEGVATPGDIEALKWLGVSTMNRLNSRMSLEVVCFTNATFASSRFLLARRGGQLKVAFQPLLGYMLCDNMVWLCSMATFPSHATLLPISFQACC